MVTAEFDEGAKFERWQQALRNPSATLKAIGALMVSESQAAFRAQKFGKDKWAPRAVPNIYGIISDFHKGVANPPQRRFEATPALVDTGGLKGAGGIVFKVAGKTVTVGTSPAQQYAAVHQTGGPIESLPISAQVRELLGAFLKGSGKKWRDQLGFLFSKKEGETLKGTVEARPFLGITKQTIEDVEEVVGVKIFEVK